MSATVKRIGLLAVAVAVGVGVGRLGASATGPAQDNKKPTVQRVDDSPQLNRLRAAVGAVSRKVNRLQRRAPVAKQTPTDEQRVNETIAAQTSAEHAGELLQTMNTEPADSDWSAARESQIRTVLNGDVFGAANVSSIRCQSSMCRVVLDFDDNAAMDRTSKQIPMTPEFASGGFIHYSSDGSSPRAEVFLTRGGPDLPPRL